MQRFEKDLDAVLQQFEIDTLTTSISEVTMTSIMASMGFI